ncbi:MAG: DUF2155 domain-containing protein [Alphaproteobacteria bacterium]
MTRALKPAALAVLLPLVLAGGAAAAPYEVAVLQGMDKVTARVSTIEAPVGEVVKFGTLEIIARHCDKRPPEETPESASFLDIWEVRQGEAAVSLFRGWMYASSPALSALEHPVYDVWVLDCRKSSSKAPSTSEGAASR